MIAKRFAFFMAGAIAWNVAVAEDTFREPFDLHLDIDGKQYYEEHFERMPYVYDNTVYLFKGDSFGVTLSGRKGEPFVVGYQPDSSKSDLTFKFNQSSDKQGHSLMMLTIQNKTSYTVSMDVLMTVPGQEGILKTNVLPISPGLTNYESWSHPIVQLALRSFVQH